MPALLSTNYNLLDCSSSNGEKCSLNTTSTPINVASHAPLKLLGEGFVQREALQLADPDRFTYYQNFAESSTFSENDADECSEYDDGYEPSQSQSLDRPGRIPCNLAIRLANRSNGPPLATIMEQHSRSTLNSRVSLPSVSCATSLPNSDHVSPPCTFQKMPNHADDPELSRIAEDVSPEQDVSTIRESRLANGSGSTPPTIKTPNQTSGIAQTHTTDFHIGDTEHSTGSQRISAFFCDVLQSVQNTSRVRSSQLIQTTMIKSKDRRVRPVQCSPRSHGYQFDIAQTTYDELSNPRLRNGSTSGPSLTPLGNSQIRGRQTPSLANVKFSAEADPPLLTTLPHDSKLMTDNSPVPPLLPPSVATRSDERFASVHPVQPTPRDGAHNGDTAKVPAILSERICEMLVHNTPESVSVYPGNAASLAQCDRAIESSRNASFCSTMSTSYSGTVLGVDLDLGHELVGIQNMPHSPSPTPIAPPVWFTPQMGELEGQASMSESPAQATNDRTNTTSHSVKSFALTSLLPIAAASGVVTPNYNTPKISFYSPSGNLIQPENSSSPGTGSSEFSGSPTMATSYFYNVRSTPIHPAPPVRPALVPMTTPPVFSAPLPAHLRHHHNYRHPENSQIVSTESFVLPSPVVRGCGGIVKSPSFTPRSGSRNQYPKFNSGSYQKHHRSTWSIVHDLKFEARFYKAGLITKACMFRRPTAKGDVLHKRRVVSQCPEQEPSSNNRDSGRSGAATIVVEEKARMRPTSREHAHSKLGPLAGHTMRICFCQPYDGVGRLKHEGATDAPCIRKFRSASDGLDQARRAGERDSGTQDCELPNARVVGKQTDCTGQGEKKAAIGRTSVGARMRSEDVKVVSIEVGLRVAAMEA